MFCLKRYKKQTFKIALPHTYKYFMLVGKPQSESEENEWM